MDNEARIMSINATLSKFNRIRNKVFTKRYGESGLTVLQVTVLWAIYENNGCIQRELCKFVDTSPTVMVGVLSTLEKNGLIERKYCATNRRIINIFITETGEEKALHMHDVIAQTEEEFMVMLTPKEKETFHKLLKKALKSWQSVYDRQP